MRDILVREFDLATASRRELLAAQALLVRLEAEAWPEDPPRSIEDWERAIRSTPRFWTVHRWLAWAGGEAVGSVSVYMFNTDHNRHIADGYIGVDPSFRRGGIAKELLAGIVAKAEEAGRTLFVARTDSAIPAGGLWRGSALGSGSCPARTSSIWPALTTV